MLHNILARFALNSGSQELKAKTLEAIAQDNCTNRVLIAELCNYANLRGNTQFVDTIQDFRALAPYLDSTELLWLIEPGSTKDILNTAIEEELLVPFAPADRAEVKRLLAYIVDEDSLEFVEKCIAKLL